MTSAIIRAIGSVLTVIVAVQVTSSAGDSDSAKIVAAIISAAVIAAVEWFVWWSPKRLEWARERLDPRAVWLGAWVQTVTLAYSSSEGVMEEETNAYSVFVVTYDVQRKIYVLAGDAYDRNGVEVAEWSSSVEMFPTFSQDGRSVSYAWRGTMLVAGERNPLKEGLATLRLTDGKSDEGSGSIQHVSLDRTFLVDVERVTPTYLKQSESTRGFQVKEIVAKKTIRQEFAEALVKGRNVQAS